jgi:YidC/Oxa1 family membrane protein insertase
MYMVVANVFQTAQSFILSKEPLPENLQKLVDAQEAAKGKSGGKGDGDRGSLAFEPGAAKRAAKEATSAKGKKTVKADSAKSDGANKAIKVSNADKSEPNKKVSKKKS